MIENLKYIDLDGVEKTEEWKPVNGYEGLYEVSNCGRVKSLDKRIRSSLKYQTTIFRKGKIITPKYLPAGYCFVILYKEGNEKMSLIHRLVATEFRKNNNNLKVVNHKDLCKSNNFYLNLEWSTHKDNTAHAMENGVMSIGENVIGSKLKEKDVLVIRQKQGKISGRKLSKEIGISSTNIYDIWNRKIWKHI